MGASEVYSKLDASWKQACRVILKTELGELEDYKDWLSEAIYPLVSRKSSLSGKEVKYAVLHYCEGAKSLSVDEVDYKKKFEPLSINEIKDIDSIVESLQERFHYTGNIVLNNSKFVEDSSNVFNSAYVLGSGFTSDSMKAAYCSYIRYGECLFGVGPDFRSSFVIKGYQIHKVVRGFEVWKTYVCNDCYYTYGLEDCDDAMFSFNTKNKKCIIGNLKLERGKYLSIREKLLSEISEEARKNKRAPTLLDFIGAKPQSVPRLEVGEKEELDKAPVERAFTATAKTVLGRELRDVDEYGDWLTRHTLKIGTVKSAVSDKRVTFGKVLPFRLLPEERVVKEPEGMELHERLKLEESQIGSLGKLRENLGKIAFFTTECRLRENRNLIDVAIATKAVNCYKGGMYSESEHCAYSYWPRNSRYMFGCENALSSHSCIHGYYSVNLSRCFEVDSSSNSLDLYFSHNCEALQDGMFCFNVKNLRRAIGNAQYSPDEYKKFKGAILEQVVDELEKRKSLKWDIYNIGCAGRE